MSIETGWLPTSTVAEWAATDPDAGGQPTTVVTAARDAAATWVAGRRPDLVVLSGDDGPDGYDPGFDVLMGATLLAVRLLGRAASGAAPSLGLAGLIATTDPDIGELLGLNKPQVG